VIALINRSETLIKASLALFLLIAAISIATYTSGSAAEAWLRGTSPTTELPPNVLSEAIHEHEDAALWATILMALTGFFSWLSLWQSRSVRKRPAWSLPLVTVLAVLAFATMSWTAYLGGHINHVEIRPDVVA